MGPARDLWTTWAQHPQVQRQQFNAGKPLGTSSKDLEAVQSSNKSEQVRRGTPIVSGVYVNGQLNDMDIMYTIDTGASCSLISTNSFDKLPQEKKPKLQKTGLRISGANGSNLKCRGKAMFQLKLGTLSLERIMIIADITDEVLLGADIMMEDEKTDILLSQDLMLMRGVEIPLVQKVAIGVSRKVYLADNCTIPAMSEIITDVFLDRTEDDALQTSWLIEPAPTLSEKYAVALASSLVDPRENVTVKIRLINPFSSNKLIPQDTAVGIASPVDVVSIISESEDCNELNNFEEIRQIKLDHSSDVDISGPRCTAEQLSE